MQRRRSHTVSILLGTSAKTALPGDPFRLGRIRLSRVLWLSVLVVMLGGLLEPEAAAQTVSFGAKTDFGTGDRPRSVAVGDFNGDGTLDLAVANRSGTVSILLGTGTGSFGAKTDFGTGGASSVAVGDFNGDGKLDLAVANDNTVSILLGTGTGSFGAKTDFDTGSGASSVAVGDFNGDGNLDLAVANFFGNTVSILLGTGTGSLGAKTDFGTGSVPASVAVGDFNGDGNLDLAVAGGDPSGFYSDTESKSVSILLGAGTGSFGAKTDFGTGFDPLSVAVGDFNGDGKLDLAVANFGSNTVSILLGTGTGSFGAKTDFDTGRGPASVAVGDFNGDGNLDLAVANLGSIFVNDPGPETVSILLNTGPTGPGCSNPIDDAQFFVRQQYLDFLGREPDPLSAEWVSLINNCTPTDTSCDRIHVSEAFFKSPEFQERGYFAYRFYSVSFGRKPDFAEFMPDLARVSGFLTTDQLEAAKVEFINDFIGRNTFKMQYDALNNQSYVDTLLLTAGVTLPNRQALIDGLTSATQTRAQVLRQIAESNEVYQKYYNQAFVVMQYFGYLRRDPDILYLDWIDVLDANPSDSRHMIEGFVNSIEYRHRFGP